MSLHTHRRALDRCVYCPKLCRWACPVAEAETRETVTPWALMIRVDDVLRGTAPLDAETAEAWTHCTGCGRCQTACKHENDVKSVLYAARAESAAAGLRPAALFAWAAEEPSPGLAYEALPEATTVGVLPGYAPAPVVDAALALLAAAGLAVGRLTLRHAGARWAEAGEPGLAEKARRAVSDLGVTRIICLEAEDAVAMAGVPGVQHLLQALPELSLRPTFAGDMLYLDSCRLGRGLGLYDPPRQWLAQAITGEVQEATMHHAEAGCCGQGAGYAALHPEAAARVAVEAAADLPDLPVVTAGGGCAAHLAQALAPRPVYHLYEVIAASLQGKSQ